MTDTPKLGSIIKIRSKNERFFVKINMIHKGKIYATVRNDLVNYASGKIDYTFGDSIVFNSKDINSSDVKILTHTSYKIFPRSK